ncbi:hypothetical protein [Nocardia sp. NPDC057668]|uniref:hypothetical protein n=1 Tax=Nocardia sp. NPDC057668 TaxID=3346202 RepID=UPI00367026DC
MAERRISCIAGRAVSSPCESIGPRTRRERRRDAVPENSELRAVPRMWDVTAPDEPAGQRREHEAVQAGDLTDDDAGVNSFLTLGDDMVRNLMDVLQRLDRLRGVLDDAKSTLLQIDSATIDVRDLVARLETDLRSANASMLAITSDWLMASPVRSGPLTLRSAPFWHQP